MTVSPSYQQRGVPNPFYTIDKPVDDKVKTLTKINEPTYRNIKEKGSLKLLGAASGKFMFQIYSADEPQAHYISIRKKDITGHLGMKSRKDTTASSNVNEFLSVFFLINPYKSDDFVRQVEDDSCIFGKKGTGVLNPKQGISTEVTYEELCALIDKDETAERDIKIGYANAIAIKNDLGESVVDKVYWCPRGKPPGVSEKNPSDTVVQIVGGDYLGYSNKISEGKDQTPKFNTNLTAYYGKLATSAGYIRKSKNQIADSKDMIDSAWNTAVEDIPKEKKLVVGAMQSFDIAEELYSESASREAFGELAKVFIAQKLDFYGKDFYHKFRNNLIRNLGNHLLVPENLDYFLKTIYFYTYEDPKASFTPCPYKLLIGRENSPSTIKDVSENADLKNVLLVKKPSQLQKIHFDYDDRSQSFSMGFDWVVNRKTTKCVKIPITCRTRAAGGWAGKSLFITTPGLKIT